VVGPLGWCGDPFTGRRERPGGRGPRPRSVDSPPMPLATWAARPEAACARRVWIASRRSPGVERDQAGLRVDPVDLDRARTRRQWSSVAGGAAHLLRRGAGRSGHPREPLGGKQVLGADTGRRRPAPAGDDACLEADRPPTTPVRSRLLRPGTERATGCDGLYGLRRPPCGWNMMARKVLRVVSMWADVPLPEPALDRRVATSLGRRRPGGITSDPSGPQGALANGAEGTAPMRPEGVPTATPGFRKALSQPVPRGRP
jgi:hypothetical protein